MNRLLALSLAVVWVIPVLALFTLPDERAVAIANVTEHFMRDSEHSWTIAAQLIPERASEFLAQRAEAEAIVADPRVLEPQLWQRWLFELAAGAVGAIGVAALWWKFPYWRVARAGRTFLNTA